LKDAVEEFVDNYGKENVHLLVVKGMGVRNDGVSSTI